MCRVPVWAPRGSFKEKGESILKSEKAKAKFYSTTWVIEDLIYFFLFVKKREKESPPPTHPQYESREQSKNVGAPLNSSTVFMWGRQLGAGIQT